MSAMRFNNSNPDRWTQPRQQTDATHRLRIYGPIQPMEQGGGLLRRLFRLN